MHHILHDVQTLMSLAALSQVAVDPLVNAGRLETGQQLQQPGGLVVELGTLRNCWRVRERFRTPPVAFR
jgi:hypothetical protein